MEPGIDEQKFQIVLNKKLQSPLEIPNYQWVVGCDPYKVEEPLNFWHKIKRKLGFKYKTKYVGWEYTVLKSNKIEGKIVVEYEGRK